MKIIGVIVTCNRVTLLKRALASITSQRRLPDQVFVVSNSAKENHQIESELCNSLGFEWLQNYRTDNYAGALNTAIEEIVKEYDEAGDLYFASLDDDDEWLPSYLETMEKMNIANYDLLAAYYLRKNETENQLMEIPESLSASDFLRGNPGIGGSNTFVKLRILLEAGCFDEAMPATVDRDILFRIFQLNPTYRIIPEHLITAHTDLDRKRVTTSRNLKVTSFQRFYYKYRHFMDAMDKDKFFHRAKVLFGIDSNEITGVGNGASRSINRQEITLGVKGDYEFVIGFIAGKEEITYRIATQIVSLQIPVDLVIIIDDTPKSESLERTKDHLKNARISTTIVSYECWNENLKSGHYGEYFKHFSEINSIPLGRTILHHHLYTETVSFRNPVYWIIDDDISFTSTRSNPALPEDIELFTLITKSQGKLDAIIGGISGDAPVPVLSCMRVQLLDLLYSTHAKTMIYEDPFQVGRKRDYYYDLSDLHSDHLEMPIFYALNHDDFENILSGKAVSRPALEREFELTNKKVTRRGANTLVLNRELLRYYPVINLEIHNRFARRGDLLWALMNQTFSSKNIAECSFSIDHQRPKAEFNIVREVEKIANDIIGYAFNKAIMKVVERIKEGESDLRPKDVFERLNFPENVLLLKREFINFLERRRSRFVMNHYRISGLLKLLSTSYKEAQNVLGEIGQPAVLSRFDHLLRESKQDTTIRSFLREMSSAVWNYSTSITKQIEIPERYTEVIAKSFPGVAHLTLLGSGAEGIVFTDEISVYKAFYNILDHEWAFLKEKAPLFNACNLLETVEFAELEGTRIIRYPYHIFTRPSHYTSKELWDLLYFFKETGIVYTNIKAENFIRTEQDYLKLIDYGKSFEPYTEDKFINSIKRATLIINNPTIDSDLFRSLTYKINCGIDIAEIQGWQQLFWSLCPRKKEQILDYSILEIIESKKPRRVLDYGAGKCKTAHAIKLSTHAEVYVFDIDRELVVSRKGELIFYDTKSDKKETFDLILLNIVLCEVDLATIQNILSDVKQLLSTQGGLIISVCNPDFSSTQQSEFQKRLLIPKDLSIEGIIKKECIYTKRIRLDQHRPTDWYLRLFSDYGFTCESTIDTPGVDFNTLLPSSDFKIFVLKPNE